MKPSLVILRNFAIFTVPVDDREMCPEFGITVFSLALLLLKADHFKIGILGLGIHQYEISDR
jgi:hypothetical protein